MWTSLIALLLNLTVVVGFSPLKVPVRYTLSPEFAAGAVCLIWDSGDEFATPGSDCHTIEDSLQRTWNKTLVLRHGTYAVWVTERGQDAQGNAFERRSPERLVRVD